MSGSGNPIDVSDKTTGGWGSTISGTRNMTVTATVANWPDTTGLDRLRGVWESGGTVNCEPILNDAGDKYDGASVTQFDVGGGYDGDGIQHHASELRPADLYGGLRQGVSHDSQS